MQYLVHGEFVDPGALLPPQQLGQIVENAVIPSLETLAKDKRVLAGGILAGTRVGVHDVVSYVRAFGGDVERVATEALPDLSRLQIEVALAWYAEHRTEVDALLNERRARYEEALQAASRSA